MKKNPLKLSSTKNLSAQSRQFEERLVGLTRNIKNQKVVSNRKHTVSLKLEGTEYEFVMDILKRAKSISQLEKTIDVLDDEAMFYFHLISESKKSIPEKGASLNDYKKALEILNIKLPRRGKRPTYSPKKVLEILDYHKTQIRKFKKVKTDLTSEQKKSAVRAVNKKYFPMSAPDSTRIFLYRKGAKNLPGGGF